MVLTLKRSMVLSIVKKDNVYFFRGYVPKKLLTLLKQQTFDKSLKTKNKNIAIIKAKPLLIRFKYLMKELELMIDSNDIYTYIDKHLDKTLKDREASLYAMPFTELDTLLNNGHLADNIDFLQYAISNNDFTIINEYVKNSLSNYSDELNDNDLYTIQQYIAKKLLEQVIYIRANVKSGYYDVEPQPQNTKVKENNNSTKMAKNTSTQQTNNLSYNIYEFLENEERESANSISAVSLRETALRSLLLEFGDIDVNDITRKDLTVYRDRLQNLPSKSLAKTNKQYKKAKSLIDIITTNRKHNYTQTTISEGTIGKYIRIVKNFFKYLNDNDYIEKDVADGLKSKKYTSDINTDERLPFSNEDLEIIFSSPFYTTKLENNINKKIEKVFAPIIAIYSGMRLNEISSLYVKDIKYEKGIYYFDINNDSDKTVKNKTSIRKIPIHKKIIEAGFIDYIDKLPKDKPLRVWENLTKKISNKETGKGTYSSNISNWFGNLKRELGFNKHKVFHSTRHTAINNLKQQKIGETDIAEIAGHSHNSITLDRYSAEYDIEEKQTTVNMITYDVKALNELLPKMRSLIQKY